MNKAMDIVSKKLCLVLISVAGEETYKIYSKSIYNEEAEIDSNVDLLVTDLEDEVSRQYDNIEEVNENYETVTPQLLLENNDVPKKRNSVLKIFLRKEKNLKRIIYLN